MTDYPERPSTLRSDLSQSDWEDMCAIVEEGLAQGGAVEIYAQWVEDGHGEFADPFLDAYVTTTDDLADWGEEYYTEVNGPLPVGIGHYVDWETFANDLDLDGSIVIMVDNNYPGTFHILNPS